jgi:hypothetical protein
MTRIKKTWTQKELNLLESEINRGVPVSQIQIGDRSQGAIVFKARQVDFTPSCRWTEEQEATLKKYIEKHGTEIGAIIPGKTVPAISGKARHMGLIGNIRSHRKNWPHEDIKLLIELAGKGMTSRQIHDIDQFSKYSRSAISGKMLRMDILKKHKVGIKHFTWGEKNKLYNIILKHSSSSVPAITRYWNKTNLSKTNIDQIGRVKRNMRRDIEIYKEHVEPKPKAKPKFDPRADEYGY